MRSKLWAHLRSTRQLRPGLAVIRRSADVRCRLIHPNISSTRFRSTLAPVAVVLRNVLCHVRRHVQLAAFLRHVRKAPQRLRACPVATLRCIFIFDIDDLQNQKEGAVRAGSRPRRFGISVNFREIGVERSFSRLRLSGRASPKVNSEQARCLALSDGGEPCRVKT